MTPMPSSGDPSIPAPEQPLLPGVPRPPAEAQDHPLAGQLLAGLDVGSNAMRLKIARVAPNGALIPVADHREPVRLGADVFRDKLVGPRTLAETIQAFRRFKGLLEGFAVTRMRAVATSALREAQNSLAVMDRLQEESGIALELITSLEEAELVVRAVTRTLDNAAGRLLIIDVGGGSVEVSIIDRGRIVAIEGFSAGTVRILQYLQDQTADEREYPHLIQAHLAFMANRLTRLLREQPVDCVIGIGGNAGVLAGLAAGDAQRTREDRPDPYQTQVLGRHQLAELTALLDSLATAQRTVLLGLPERRADVIQPAAYLYLTALEAAGAQELLVPGVGVRDGLLWQLADPHHLAPPELATPADQVYRMAFDLAERYRADLPHAEQVALLAGRLFDDLAEIHRLPESDRVLLTAAALLHDVGHLVNHGKHHIHTYYLIRNADFYGLPAREQELMALAARFHRKADPDPGRHPEFAALPHHDRVRVAKLTALLRLADALDRTHSRAVTRLEAHAAEGAVVLRLVSPGDLEIERWALERNAGLFQRVFLTNLTLECQQEALPHHERTAAAS